MRRRLFSALVLALCACPTARADDAHGVDDPRFALSLRAGILHTDDDTFEATWYRPATLEASAWTLRGSRRWLNGLQVYGSAGLESADVDYREQPTDYQEGLAGIHHADIAVERGWVFGIGARGSIYDDGRFRLTGFADAAFPSDASDVQVDALLIDLEGLKIDVAKAVRNNASVSYEGRAYRLGITGAVRFRTGSLRWTPYLTFGWLRYRAKIAFETNDALKEALKSFGVDPAVLSDRAIVESDAFFAPGVRLDVSRAWSLETQALLGRYDGTWVAAGTVGVAWRFGP
ncbi:MAG TPA: hypothetical protein VL283_01870 [Candidatus Baltobacteraceae bacterium]|nr:hypothetical protein [Candidatus Baltobacteraceae bacterium]